MVVFLLPSLKLKERDSRGKMLEDKLHEFLLGHFNGYTASAANLFGYWKNASGRAFYGEHKEYKVSLLSRSKIAFLERFLISMAEDMGEESIYLSAGDDSWLLYPLKPQDKRMGR